MAYRVTFPIDDEDGSMTTGRRFHDEMAYHAEMYLPGLVLPETIHMKQGSVSIDVEGNVDPSRALDAAIELAEAYGTDENEVAVEDL